MASQAPTVTDYEALSKKITAGDLKKIYLFHGDEPFFIDRLVELFLRDVIRKEDKSFNQHLVYGNEVQGNSLEFLCRQAPMQSDKKLVVVREAQDIKDISSLVNYSEKPSPTTILVICFHGQLKTGKGLTSNFAKLVANVRKNGVVYQAQPLRDYQVEPWLTSYVSTLQLRFSPQAMQLLEANVGGNLTRMAHEIEKLRIAVVAEGGEGEVTAEMVEKIVGLQRNYSLFDFQRALGYRNRPQALRIANYLATSGDSSVNFLSVIAVVLSYFQKVFLFHVLRSRMDDRALAESLGVNPYFLKEYAQVASQFSMSRCAYIFGKLRQMDLQAKGLGAAHMSFLGQLRLLIATVIE